MTSFIEKIEVPSHITRTSAITKFELTRIQMTSTYLKKNYIRNGNFYLNKFSNLEYGSIRDFISDNNLEREQLFKDSQAYRTKDGIIQIFFSKKYNTGGKKAFNYTQWGEFLENRLNEVIENGHKIHIIFPGFPFKIRNRLKNPSGQLDSAELFALIKLKNFISDIENIYKNGCQITILLDGFLYCEAFGINKNDVTQYQNQLNEHIRLINMSRQIKLVDLNSLLIDNDDFLSLIKQCNLEMIKYWNENFFSDKIQGLIRNTIANINLWECDDSIYEALFSVDSNHIDLLEVEKIVGFSKKTAFIYMTIQLAIERSKLYENLYPEAIRFTVHPKSKQIGIKLARKNNYLLPWMGCGVIYNQTTTCRYFCELDPSLYKAVYIKNRVYPYAFIKSI